jgi:phage tail sheath gpL-like
VRSTPLAFAAGVAAGFLVTRRVHATDRGVWSSRLGGTRYRVGDLPVGGTVAAALSLVAPARARRPLRAWAAGATVGVAAVALSDPL